MNMQSSVYGEHGWNTDILDQDEDEMIFDPDSKAARPNPNFVSSGDLEEERDDGADDDLNFGQAHLDLVIMEGSGLNHVKGSWVSGKFLIPGRSDPYVVCRSSSGQILTMTKPLDSRRESTDQAVWNHYAGVPYLRGQALAFEVHDTESSVVPDDAIATAMLQAEMMKPGVHELPLVDKEGNKGSLKVGVISTPTKPLHDQELVVMVASAKRLHNVFEENFGALKSSAYVVCEVPGKEDKLNFKTQTVKHDLYPKWNFPSVLRFKNFDACEKLKFSVFHDTGDKPEAHQLLGTGIINPEDIMVGVHRIPLCDEMGQPVVEDSVLKVRIFSVPKLLRIVARKNETERRKREAAEEAGMRWEDMTPEQQEEFLQQKESAKADRKRAKELRRALRQADTTVPGGNLNDEILRLREEVARLRVERDRTWAGAPCSTSVLDEQARFRWRHCGGASRVQVAELQRQQQALKMSQIPSYAAMPLDQEMAYQKLRSPALMSSTAAPMAYAGGGVPMAAVPYAGTALGALQQCSPVQQTLGELQQAISSLGLGATAMPLCSPQQARFGGYGQIMAPHMMSPAF